MNQGRGRRGHRSGEGKQLRLAYAQAWRRRNSSEDRDEPLRHALEEAGLGEPWAQAGTSQFDLIFGFWRARTPPALLPLAATREGVKALLRLRRVWKDIADEFLKGPSSIGVEVPGELIRLSPHGVRVVTELWNGETADEWDAIDLRIRVDSPTLLVGISAAGMPLLEARISPRDSARVNEAQELWGRLFFGLGADHVARPEYLDLMA